MSETPETDAAQIFLGFTPDEGDYFVPVKTAHKLERERNEAVNNYETAVLREHRMQEQRDRLAEERDELKSKYRTHHDEAERITKQIAAVTEQRDRLAKALDKVIDPRCSDREKFIHAAEALAAVKGGSHE